MTRTRTAAGILLAGLGLFCWAQALGAANRLQGLDREYRLRFGAVEALTPGVLDRLEQETLSYVLVRESAARVSAAQFSRRQELTVVEVIGDGALLFPLQAVTGTFPREGGCVIDRDSAQALWGDAMALGKTVTWEGRDYVVSGVLFRSRPLLLVGGDGRDSFTPTSAVVRPSRDTPFPRQELEAFLGRLGLAAPPVTWDLARVADLLRLAALFPAWLFCLVLAARGLRDLLPGRWTRLMVLAGAGWLLARVFRFPPLIPPELLPTRWSDFGFWRRRLLQAAESLAARWLQPGALADYLLLWEAVLPTLGWSVCALAGLFLAQGILRDRGSRGVPTE